MWPEGKKGDPYPYTYPRVRDECGVGSRDKAGGAKLVPNGQISTF